MLAKMRLETERLILRPIDPDRDFEGWAEAMADEATVRFIGGQVMNHAQAWRSMAMVLGHWQIRGYGFFSVEEKSSGRWVGRVGPWYPLQWPGTEVGWTIARPYWGRGYATEAARAAMRFAFDELGWTRIVHTIQEGNVASEAVARKLGSVHVATQQGLPGVTEATVLIYAQDAKRAD